MTIVAIVIDMLSIIFTIKTRFLPLYNVVNFR